MVSRPRSGAGRHPGFSRDDRRPGRSRRGILETGKNQGMKNEDVQKRAFLRRAVSPNLFTSTLHPEFIPALVTANLMTPCLWEWAAASVSGVDVSNPIAGLQAIHHFLNK